MDLSITDGILIGVAIFASSFIQATVGFGSGLVGIPLMLLAGIDLALAVTLNLLTSTIQNSLGLRKSWRLIDWTSVTKPLALRTAGLPLGVLALFLFETHFGDDKSFVRMGVGFVILVTLGTQARRKPDDSIPISELWSYVAFPLSGLMQGFIGLAGPPMVIWVIAKNWPAERSRGFLFLMLLSTAPLHFLLYVVIWPQQVKSALLIFSFAFPVSILATLVGLYTGRRLNKLWLRRIAYGLLAMIAVNCLISPWIS